MSAQSAPASRWQQLRTHWWRLAPTDAGAVQLTHRRIYILPTRRGIAFLFTLLLMLLGALNYALSLKRPAFITALVIVVIGQLLGMIFFHASLAAIATIMVSAGLVGNILALVLVWVDTQKGGGS